MEEDRNLLIMEGIIGKIKEEDLFIRNVKKTREKLKKAEICILGLGGLGSNVAMLLARAGVGKIKLVDLIKLKLVI